MLTTYWEYLSYSGVKPGDKLDEIQRIVLLNRIAVFVGLIPFFGAILWSEDLGKTERILEVATAGFLLCVPLLNRFTFPRVVRALAFLVGMVNLVAMTVISGLKGGDILFVFPAFAAATLIVDLNNAGERFFLIVIGVATMGAVVGLFRTGEIVWEMEGIVYENRFLFNFLTACLFTVLIILYNYHLHQEDYRLLVESANEQASLNKELSSINEALRAREQEILQARDRAEEANQAKARFLSAISHELRTPLHPVVGYSDLLVESDLSAEQKQHVEEIRKEAANLTHLIDDILDYAKIEAGKLTITPHPMSIRELVSEVSKTLSARAGEKGLHLRPDVDEAVSDWVYADSFRLRQVLYNLIANAIKFSREGDIVIRVEGAPRKKGAQSVTLSVIDNGPGIAREDMARIFEPFFQADTSATRRFQGAGLGLSICANLVEMMNSELKVESEPGKGSNFYFTLTLESARQNMEESLGPHGVVPDGLRVLIVEDNAVNRRVTRHLLEKLGISADVAEDGAIGLEKIKANSYDLVLMDIHMPIMDGVEATRRTRKEVEGGDKIRIVGLTANAIKEDVLLYQNAGMDDVLVKPLQLAVLREKLAAWFGS